jgi:hypothetical protein
MGMKREGKKGEGGKGRGFSQLLSSSYNPLLGFETVRAMGCSEMAIQQHFALRCKAKLVEMLGLDLIWFGLGFEWRCCGWRLEAATWFGLVCFVGMVRV